MVGRAVLCRGSASRWASVLVALGFLVPASVSAAPITWELKGKIANVSGSALGFSDVQVGEDYRVLLTIDSGAQLISTNSGGKYAPGARYNYSPATLKFDVTIGARPAVQFTSAMMLDGQVTVRDDSGEFVGSEGIVDAYTFVLYPDASHMGGVSAVFRGQPLDVVTGPGFPVVPDPRLVAMALNFFQVVDTNAEGQLVGFSGPVSSIKAAVVGPQYVQVGELPDTNSDGLRDLAVIRSAPVRAEVRSGANGALLTTIGFIDEALSPVVARSLPDTDGDGIAEIALLATRKSDGRGVVEIRNLTGASPARQVWFAAGQRPLALAVIEGDADNNGVAELAVLSSRNSDGRGLVEVKNAYGPTYPVSIWVGAGLTPGDIEVVEDADNNGVPEVAVLATRTSDGRIVVEVKNAVGPTNPSAIWFMTGQTAVDLAVVPDADKNTVPEVAVLSSRKSDGRGVVEVKNAAGVTNPNAVWFAAGHTALAVDSVADSNGDSVPEVAVLSQRNSDGRVLVEVKNAAGATSPRALWYPTGYAARDLAILDDLDGNGIDEAGVLLIRRSDTRILVEGRNASGTQLPKDYWFSP